MSKSPMYEKPAITAASEDKLKRDLRISVWLKETSSLFSFSKYVRFMSVKGSSEAPKRFFSLRQFFATPRITPADRLRHTTILSASARLYVRRIRASVSNSDILRSQNRSQAGSRNKIEDPTERQANDYKLSKHLHTVNPTLSIRVFGNGAKHDRSKGGKQ